jgi:HlyD family secretion protein
LMAAGQSGAVLRDIQTLFDIGTASGLSDRQLLERFACARDAAGEAAFEALVLRHGPMVMRVCRNVLRNLPDAEDAFQATFLVLVRRRGSIGRFESVGGWLNGVACRVAARARVAAARRRAVEERAGLRLTQAFDSAEADDPSRLEFGLFVQEEVRRLPGKYRDVVVRCYWQGLTHEQVAAELGCPLGTVRSRMGRARDLLRRRLMRRGLAPLAASVAAALDRTALAASTSSVSLQFTPVPPELVHSTIRFVSQSAVVEATAPLATGLAGSLVQRAIWSMTMSKISAVLVGAGLLGLAGYGAGVAVSKGQVAQSKSKQSDKPTPRKLQKTTVASSIVASAIRGETSILMIVPNGSTVKKGQLVCELDPAALRDSLTNQQITTKSAEANFRNAQLARESAKMDVAAYVDDLLPREKRESQEELKVAEAEVALAEGQLRLLETVGGDELKVKERELAVARAKLAREKAVNRLHILETYTQDKQTKRLNADVEKAYSNERAKMAVWDLERVKEEKLTRQIASCKMIAPRDGTLVYAHPPVGRDLVGAGALVGERQPLFEIFESAEVRGEGQK